MPSASTGSGSHFEPQAPDGAAATRRRIIDLALIAGVVAFVGLSYLSQSPPCLGYADPRTSAYGLPYPVGRAYTVFQGNCATGGHHGNYRYRYDFLMPIGGPVTAAREGVVAETLEGFPDGGPSENWVKIGHGEVSKAGPAAVGLDVCAGVD